MWNRANVAIRPTFCQSCMYPAMYSPFPPNPITSIGYPWILFSNIPVACNVLSGIRFTKAPVSTRALLWEYDLWKLPSRGILWFKYPTSMSSSLKIISLLSCRKALLVRASAVRHSFPTPKTMHIKASVAILHLFVVSSNCLTKFWTKSFSTRL